MTLSMTWPYFSSCFRTRSCPPTLRFIPLLHNLIQFPGHVTDLHCTVSHRQPKLRALHNESNGDSRNLGRAGKAHCLTHEAFEPGAQRQVLALALLRVTLARLGRIRIEMTRVRAPLVCIILRDAKRF